MNKEDYNLICSVLFLWKQNKKQPNRKLFESERKKQERKGGKEREGDVEKESYLKKQALTPDGHTPDWSVQDKKDP